MRKLNIHVERAGWGVKNISMNGRDDKIESRKFGKTFPSLGVERFMKVNWHWKVKSYRQYFLIDLQNEYKLYMRQL